MSLDLVNEYKIVQSEQPINTTSVVSIMGSAAVLAFRFFVNPRHQRRVLVEDIPPLYENWPYFYVPGRANPNENRVGWVACGNGAPSPVI